VKHSFAMVRVSPVNHSAAKTWGKEYTISGTGLLHFLYLPLRVL